jgi:nitroimidazol reductase NimA-like FMN-containing flavoprotein (pyridoxamine 5'-phosphate oxidase superfamily)
MRRRDKKIKDQGEIEEIIRKAVVCRIAVSDGDSPYIFPVCFGYKDGFLYFHSAPEGKKIEILRKNSKVCFEMDIDTELIRGKKGCDWGVSYRSVIGFGTSVFIESPEEKKRALNTILDHYANRYYDFSEESLEDVVLVKIQVESLTGKKSV